MSLEIKGEKCAVCNAYLFEEDDVVYCPECGAPHHRECYNSLGECGLKQFHGTDNQYKRPEETQKVFESNAESKMVTCGMCGEKYDIDDVCCPSCNAPNISKMGGRVISIDLLGGVPSNTDIGDGITAEEAKKFVAWHALIFIKKVLDSNDEFEIISKKGE
jgi:Zn finger protein HypA/HybF involved in hydrogenase expression